MSTKIAIVGSRNYANLDAVKKYITNLPKNTIIVSGGARGVDKVAEQTAQSIGLETVVYKADWHTYGKSAGMLRNTTIVENADAVVAFWDGKSRGTLDTITKGLHAENITQVTVYKA